MTFNGWNLDASRAIPAARVALREEELEAKGGEERRRRERLADGTLLLWEANFVPLALPFWTSFDMIAVLVPVRCPDRAISFHKDDLRSPHGT
jgi:hypothetical protein